MMLILEVCISFNSDLLDRQPTLLTLLSAVLGSGVIYLLGRYGSSLLVKRL